MIIAGKPTEEGMKIVVEMDDGDTSSNMDDQHRGGSEEVERNDETS